MRADTQTISIDTAPDQVQRYLGGPQNLPRWAVGFAKAVRPATDGGWVVEAGAGEMGLRIDVDARTGTIDFWMTPAPGVLVLAAQEYVFTQFQGPGMPDDVFARSVQTLRHELTVLKALLEVECPL